MRSPSTSQEGWRAVARYGVVIVAVAARRAGFHAHIAKPADIQPRVAILRGLRVRLGAAGTGAAAS